MRFCNNTLILGCVFSLILIVIYNGVEQNKDIIAFEFLILTYVFRPNLLYFLIVLYDKTI